MATAPKKTRGKVGVIGLGIIGTRVAANLRSAGHQVYVWSRTPRAAPNFLGSVVEVADLCDVIQLFVSDDGALAEVTRTVATALRPRHVVLGHATVSPGAAREAARIVEEQGARYLDAPFTGSKTAAQNRQLVYYVGGAKPVLEEVRPILEATSKTVLHVGGVGDASLLKIATNMMTASIVQTLAEALALVRAAGIDPSKLAEALENNGSRSGTSDLKLSAMIAGNTEPNFSLKHMLKDVRFAQQLADQYELSLPVTDTAAEVLGLGMQNGWAEQDFSVVAQLYAPPPGSEPGLTPAALNEPTKEAPASSGKPPAIDEVKPAPAILEGGKPLAAKSSKSGSPTAEGTKPPAPTARDDEAAPDLPPRVPAPAKTDDPAGKQDVSTPGAAVVLPAASPAVTPLADTAEATATGKKRTLRFLRDFFKQDLPEPR